MYRGTTREEAERAYHADARVAASEGYVPTSEQWSYALGQQVLTVGYVHLPDQAASVLAALSAFEREPSRESPPPSKQVAPQVTTAAAQVPHVGPKKSSNTAVGCLGLVVIVVGAYLLFGRGGSGDNDDNGSDGGTAPAAKHLTGEFVLWEPVDDAHGYAYFTVTNNGTTTETAECTIKVDNDFGNFGFDYLVGERVGPGETISGKVALDVGEGSFLINHGEVTDC